MNILKKLIIVSCFLSLVQYAPMGLSQVHAVQAPVTIIIDNLKQNYKQQPFIVDGTTMVPMSAIFRTLGASVEWDSHTRTVTAKKGLAVIKVVIGSKTATVNNVSIELRVAPEIVLGYTFVPLKFVSEALGAEVTWDGKTRTVFIVTAKGSGLTQTLTELTKSVGLLQDNSGSSLQDNSGVILQGISIGNSESQVIKKLGSPARKDLSEYGFTWYIYNQSYKKYIQVGVQQGTVVALYGNTSPLLFKGVKLGSGKANVIKLYGTPLTAILKRNVKYSLDSGTGVGKEYGTYLINGSYVTFFYDNHLKDTVTAVQIIEQKVEQSLTGFFGKPSVALRKGFERQNFDLTNAIRVRFGKKTLQWDDNMADLARKHSQDMIDRDFFAHVNPSGDSPFDRMTNAGIQYKAAAENIFAGSRSAIYAHEGWMNSEGHRHNILSDIARMGVGVSFGGSYQVYVTQDFYTIK